MSQPDQKAKVSLEDLLRLKRAERPSPEFWANFERELRQKQLTALVQKRRWWHELPVLLNRRIYLPAGAAAIVAFALVAIKYSAPTQIAQLANAVPKFIAADPAIEMLAATEVSVSESVFTQSSRYEDPVVISANFASSVPVTSEAGFSTTAMPRDAEAPAKRAMVANLTRLEPLESELVDSALVSHLGTPARVQSASAVQSEVASMTTASGSKYRLIARYVDRSLSPAPAAPAVVRERLARRLGDDLEGDISRIGVVGSRVSLKF